MIKQFRSGEDLEKAEDNADLSKVIFILNKTIESYRNFNKSLSIQSSFNGYIATNVVIPATSSVKIQHFLGVLPKWRIVLRQTGNGVITDIPSEWNDKVISLYNNGSVSVTLTVFIARE